MPEALVAERGQIPLRGQTRQRFVLENTRIAVEPVEDQGALGTLPCG